MTRLILLLALPVALVACTTPRETCLKSATKDLAVIDRLIIETQGNLQRGYGVTREPYTASRVDVCVGSGRYRYGSPGLAWNYCSRPETRYRDKPVAIDRTAEKRKLAELKQTRAKLVKETNQRIGQCDLRYPN
ncbi:hypothetical protein CLV78_103238 [Aliiruegeria haliotis]|uniref:Endonuclease YncB(Thermonuclease family) n=1 Tax=Aliiruegeria haliotis TaxID=1280846 RepID=A0A2T0RTA1_9RHOB|nr:hypothetical protein [Aliiruegeria haliotis]PRY24372.1 hypothetical protein CLV78_103238 [Aliiruegeria haliotis]